MLPMEKSWSMPYLLSSVKLSPVQYPILLPCPVSPMDKSWLGTSFANLNRNLAGLWSRVLLSFLYDLSSARISFISNMGPMNWSWHCTWWISSVLSLYAQSILFALMMMARFKVLTQRIAQLKVPCAGSHLLQNCFRHSLPRKSENMGLTDGLLELRLNLAQIGRSATCFAANFSWKKHRRWQGNSYGHILAKNSWCRRSLRTKMFVNGIASWVLHATNHLLGTFQRRTVKF